MSDRKPLRLLNLSNPHKPRPAKGTYSLSRLFLSFYLLVMGAFISIAFFADVVISNALRGITNDYTSRFMQGTVMLIEAELFRHPRSEWNKVIAHTGENFAYKIAITDRWSLILPKVEAEKLDSGRLAVDGSGEIIYHRLRQTPEILVLGPMVQSNVLESAGGSLELRIRLLTWILIGLCLAIAVWLWVRPVWKDLETLRQTALFLGDGQFERRAPKAHSGALELLTETLNSMAERVQRLIASQKEIASAISHELRTPIARMRFAFEMLLETSDQKEEERLSHMIESDLNELDALIDSSLSYARFEREQPKAEFTSIHFLPWLEEKVAALRILNSALHISVSKGGLPSGFFVDLDEKSMPYAITNLLRNAIRYAKEQIVVSVKMKEAHILVHVDDDGIGIPEADRERVFTAYTRLDQARDRQTGGYGLGLAITRLVLEQHHGRVYVEDSPLGGARFTLTWPIVQWNEALLDLKLSKNHF